jgi:hypothetical protein
VCRQVIMVCKVKRTEDKMMQIIKTEKEKMLNGQLYNAADPELLRDRMNARKITR